MSYKYLRHQAFTGGRNWLICSVLCWAERNSTDGDTGTGTHYVQLRQHPVAAARWFVAVEISFGLIPPSPDLRGRGPSQALPSKILIPCCAQCVVGPPQSLPKSLTPVISQAPPSIPASSSATYPNKQRNASLLWLLNPKPKFLILCQFLANEQFNCLSNLEK